MAMCRNSEESVDFDRGDVWYLHVHRRPGSDLLISRKPRSPNKYPLEFSDCVSSLHVHVLDV